MSLKRILNPTWRFTLVFLIFLISCGKEDPCEIFNTTLNGTFQSLLTPDTFIVFAGGSTGTSSLFVGSSLVSLCSYVVEDCTNGYTVSECGVATEVGTIEVTDMDLIHIAGVPFVRIN